MTDDELAAQLLDHADRLEAWSWGTSPTGFIRQAARRLVELAGSDVNAEAAAMVAAHQRADRKVGRPPNRDRHPRPLRFEKEGA